MITRERLLAGLNELIYVEEGMVTMFAKFTGVMADEAEGLDDRSRKEIKGLLARLHRDSARHKEMVEAMARQVREGGRDEY